MAVHKSISCPREAGYCSGGLDLGEKGSPCPTGLGPALSRLSGAWDLFTQEFQEVVRCAE